MIFFDIVITDTQYIEEYEESREGRDKESRLSVAAVKH